MMYRTMPHIQRPLSRRQFGKLTAAATISATLGGCTSSGEAKERPPEKVWGSLGGGNGQFSKPRAIAIDAQDQLYIVDMTARIQVFDVDGNFIRSWQTPEQKNGRPTGLSISSVDGTLMVADT